MVEVFGHHVQNLGVVATQDRIGKRCPFTNSACQKDKKDDPLGVCSVEGGAGHSPAITCPKRFEAEGLIFDDASDFFFGPGVPYTKVPEIRLVSSAGERIGNIDWTLCRDGASELDYGCLEVQAVYISGTVRPAFTRYMAAPDEYAGDAEVARADWLSSKKRLGSQLVRKCQAVAGWDRKMAVALQKELFLIMPPMPPVPKEEADMAWLLYELVPDSNGVDRVLRQAEIVYTRLKDFELAWNETTSADEEAFIRSLGKRNT